MTSKDAVAFKLQSINFPKIHFNFFQRPTEDKYIQAVRVDVQIVNETTLRVLFGLQLTSEELISENTPCARVLVETLSVMELTQALPGTIKSVIDVPLLGNMLAVVFPFLREKINYCLSNNGINLILLPINTIDLLEKNFQNEKMFSVSDARKPQLSGQSK